VLTFVCKSCIGVTVLACALFVARESGQQTPARTVLLEVVRNSWDVQRDETLVYVRVYTDGFAEAHPMRKVDFRNIQFETKQLSGGELAALGNLLSDPAVAQLQPEYSRSWGNKDFGYNYIVAIFGPFQKKVELVNFQPFLARKEGKPYPKQLEKLGCTVWRIRSEVSGELLEKDWLKGCAELGY
jgi:hypothetical protein